MPSSPDARNLPKRFEMRVELEATRVIMVWKERLEQARVSVHVLVAAAGEIEDDEVVLLELRQTLDKTGDGVGRFERGDDAFGARKKARGFESRLIGDGGIFGTPLIGQPGVFGADGGIVEPGGNGMRCGDLPIFVLQNVSVGALQDARSGASKSLMRGEASSVFAEFSAAATGLDADHFHIGVAEEIIKEADGIRTAADAGEKMRGQALFGGEDLLAGFAADHGLKIAHHRGIRMRAENGAE